LRRLLELAAVRNKKKEDNTFFEKKFTLAHELNMRLRNGLPLISLKCVAAH
jgi:hypothetical protein